MYTNLPHIIWEPSLRMTNSIRLSTYSFCIIYQKRPPFFSNLGSLSLNLIDVSREKVHGKIRNTGDFTLKFAKTILKRPRSF